MSATGDCGTLGQTYASLTLAYAPSDLSTVAVPGEDVKKINYADLFTNCTGDARYFATQSDTDFLQKHCFPSLTYPTTGLQSVDPAWANCDSNRVLNFINDPPRVLLPATTLGPGPGPTEDPRSSTDASPVPLVPPPVPSKTDPPSGSPSTTNAGNEAPETSPTDPSSVGGPPPANPPPQSSAANGFEEPSISTFPIPVSGELGWSGTVINSNSVVVAGATVVAGAPASQVSGHQVSVDPVASNIVVDGHVYPLPAPNPSSSDPGPTDPVDDPLSSNSGQNNPVNDPVSSDPGQNDPVNDPTSSNTVIDGYIIQTTQSPDIIVVDGQQIVRGANPIMASGIPVTLRSNGDLILGTSTLPGFIPTASAAPGKVITIAGRIFTILSNGVAVAGQTLSTGQGTTVSGTPVSLGLDGLVIAGSTIKLPVTPTAPVITTAGQTFRLLSNGVAVDGQTLSIGQGITVSGTPMSLGMDGLVIASSMINLPAVSTAQLLTAAGQTITIGANGGVIIAGTTLVPIAPAVYIAGKRISLGPNGLIVGISTISLPTVTPAAVVSAAGQAGILGSDGYFTIAGTALSPEAPAITVAGTLISLGSNGLIIGTSTLPLPPISMVTIAGHAYPVSKVSNGFVIGSSTLHNGQPAITISGTPVVLEGSGLVIGTSTVPYQDIAPSSALEIGNFILSGINGGFAAPSMTGVGGSNQTLNNATGNTGSVVAFQGDANRMRGTRSILPALAIVVFWTWLEGVLCRVLCIH